MFAWQALLVGLPSVSHSSKPAPMRPSPKNQFLLTGPVAGGMGVPLGVGEIPGVGGVVPAGISATLLLNSSEDQTLLLPSTASPSCGCPLALGRVNSVTALVPGL